MPHANAPLTPTGRLHLARFRVVEGATIRRAAERFNVSTTTVCRWTERFQEIRAEGREPVAADMQDRSSRPHHSPSQTAAKLERKILKRRVCKRIGPAEIGYRVGLATSTVHAVLRRHHLNRLDHLDRATGEQLRVKPVRYERASPGELIHLDVKKTARIPDDGPVHKTPTGQRIGGKRRRHKPGRGNRKAGFLFLHTALDDHSRLAYTEALDDETAATAAAFWHRARAFFAAHGMTVQEILTDNGPCYVSATFNAALDGVKHRYTRPYRPQTNGKVERFHRTLLHWVYAEPWPSESARITALDGWLQHYNHRRPHTALGRRPPISRTPQPHGL